MRKRRKLGPWQLRQGLITPFSTGEFSSNILMKEWNHTCQLEELSTLDKAEDPSRIKVSLKE